MSFGGRSSRRSPLARASSSHREHVPYQFQHGRCACRVLLCYSQQDDGDSAPVSRPWCSPPSCDYGFPQPTAGPAHWLTAFAALSPPSDPATITTTSVKPRTAQRHPIRAGGTIPSARATIFRRSPPRHGTALISTDEQRAGDEPLPGAADRRRVPRGPLSEGEAVAVESASAGRVMPVGRRGWTCRR